MPGLLAVTPPRRTARGREHTSLITYLTLAGNAPLSNAELLQLANDAAGLFYQASGSLTFAMRNVANDINSKLLARNLAMTGQGQQALGLLVLAAVREDQCTLLLSGPTHAVWVTDGGSRHIHDPALSGKGLGSGQSISAYLSQVQLHPQDLLVLCGIFPRDWEADLLNERPPASLDASYRKLTFTKGDLNAVLVQAQGGHGTITLLRPDVTMARRSKLEPAPVISEVTAPSDLEPRSNGTHEEKNESADLNPPVHSSNLDRQESQMEQPPITEEQLDSLADFAAHLVQPSAYAIPPQPESAVPLSTEEVRSTGTRGFPASIPRAKPAEQEIPSEENTEIEEQTSVEEETVQPPARVRRKRWRLNTNAHAEATRQMAKAMVGGIRTGRRVNERLGAFLRKFVPRLLPSGESKQAFTLPTYVLIMIAVVIPIMVVTMASVVYLRFGQSIQYDEFYGQALNTRALATSETDPARQRDDWQSVLTSLNKADQYRETDESKALRAEAQTHLDNLMGVIRLEFIPAFPNGLGSSAQIGRMTASESDLYMLNAEEGKILHASFTGRSLDLDKTFNCQPGSYGGYQVGPLIDILALPKVNALNATVLGIDANGNLLYCAPDQVPQAIPLPPLPNTNWGRITAIALDNGDLYVLDAQKRSIWIFPGKDSTFIDSPAFYFGNEIPPNIDSAIDLAVSGEDLYMLHADGHLSTCRLSPLSEVPTRCQDPAPRVDPNPAHRDIDIFQLAHFTQLAMTNQPNAVILLLDSENQSVFRFSPRSFELQNQVTGYAGKADPFQRGSVSAMAVSPNYVLYLAIGDQVYFATNLP
ncbi:MAG TPA: hypothetical protein VK206_20175 [Anaerolineales bacterium]|nr:hypothetical protein [Anaerolineales bacterium]